jgi:threonine synthase
LLNSEVFLFCSVDGTFDDCQAIVKAAFNDPAFRKSVSLGAVNSINWARVLAQMTYYFWSYFRVTDESPAAAGSLNFSVPTGNFGDVLAGYYAKRMGLPLGKLLVATNENDILHRFFTSGKYWREGVVPTLSPSMDICVSSNFERYLFHLCGDDAAVLKSWFDVFEKTGKLTVNEEQLSKAQSDFISACVKTEQNLAHIKEQWDIHGYLYCPHASIGGAAVAHHDDLKREHTVVLATAHAAKFPTAVGKVVDPLPPAPEQLQALWGMPTRKVSLPNDLHAVQNHIRKTLGMPTTSKKGCSSRSLLVLAGIAAGTAVIVGLVLARRR